MRGRSIPASFDFFVAVSTDSLMFSLRMQERFDMTRFEIKVPEQDVLLKEAVQKQRNEAETYLLICKYQPFLKY